MKTVYLGSVTAILLAGQVAAQELGFAAEIYQEYCATCHGMDATGQGEMLPFLTQSVPDLTRLAIGNNGSFPMGHVIRVIDGRSKSRGHVGPMPYFMPLFSRQTVGDLGTIDAIVDANGRILLLAKYIESIQIITEPEAD